MNAAMLRKDSLVLSPKFHDFIIAAVIVVLTGNVIFTGIWQWEETKLILEPTDNTSVLDGFVAELLPCMTVEWRIPAVTQTININYPQKWFWRITVTIASGASFYIVPLTVQSRRIKVLAYIKEMALIIISFCLDLTTPALADQTGEIVWVIHMTAVLVMGVSCTWLASELQYRYLRGGMIFVALTCPVSLAISRLMCVNYMYTVFVIMEYIGILLVIAIHRFFIQECIRGKYLKADPDERAGLNTRYDVMTAV